MSRIKELQKKVHKILEKIDGKDQRARAVAHLDGVSLAAVMIAKKRGENPELAAMAGLLHDLYAYKSGSYDNHAHLGAKYARKLLDKMHLTAPEETDMICSAIRHHGDKEKVHAPLDEVLKDADVIHHCLADPTKEMKEQERERYTRLCEEFGMR